MSWEPLPDSDERGPKRVGELLEPVVRTLTGATTRVVATVFNQWAEVAGEHIAAHTQPSSLDRGVLIVHVDDGAWAAQLRFFEQDLLTRINAITGADQVTRIEFRVRPKV